MSAGHRRVRAFVRRWTFLTALPVLGWVLAPGAALAADAAKPHEHQGKLKPYARPPPPLELSDAEKKALGEGRPVMRQTEGDATSGRGMAVFRVDASPDVVWATINDFGSYPKWIDGVKKCAVYKKEGGLIDVEFQVSSFPVSADYFIHHDFDMANRWGTWTLDYTRNSDLDDSVGFWRVNPAPGDRNQSLVEYSVDVAAKAWLPGFVRTLIVDTGLKQATQWVKVQSEKKAGATKHPQ
jgi:ribosome-associated toxin RatA of RatAB toxin-antitoxin module